jgi:hypothetical protein
MASTPSRPSAVPPHRPSPLDGPPDLGNGRERLDDEGTGIGRDDGPESQGRSAGQGFGFGSQGEYGDEDFDPEDQRVTETISGVQVEHVGPGRGAGGQAVVIETPAPKTGGGVGRPDDGIREEIVEMFADTDDEEDDDLVIDVRDGVVTLEGTVEDDAAREAIEAAVVGVDGVRGVENLLEVRDPDA